VCVLLVKRHRNHCRAFGVTDDSEDKASITTRLKGWVGGWVVEASTPHHTPHPTPSDGLTSSSLSLCLSVSTALLPKPPAPARSHFTAFHRLLYLSLPVSISTAEPP